MLAALLLALAAAARPPVEVLFDDLVEIRPGQVRSLAIAGGAPARRVVCSWVVHRGAAVRLILLPAADVDAWLQHRPHAVRAESGFARAGTVAYVRQPDDELVLLMEAGGGAGGVTRLRLLVRLVDPLAPFPVQPHGPDPWRGAIVVWGSLGIFAALATFSVIHIRRNWRRRWVWM